jgi:hypothetical protein
VEQLAQAGTWPTEEEYLTEWLAEHTQVLVSVEVHSSVGEFVEGHTTCRSLLLYSLPIRCFNLISHLQYSTVSTSCGSCASYRCSSR